MADEQPRAGEAPDQVLPILPPQRSGAALSDAVTSPARLDQVLRTRLLDTEPEEAFDRFARLVATILGQVTAFVTVADDRRSFGRRA